MKGKEKQREVKVSKKKNMAASSSDDDDDDSDVERNFALLTKRGGGGGGGAEEGEPHHGGEEDFSDEDEEGSDGGTEEEEEEEDEEEGSDVGEEDSDASKDDGDEGPEDAGGSGEIQTRDDVKKELSNMSFEDIMKLQSQVGTKVYNEVAYGSKKSQEAVKKKRLNKKPVSEEEKEDNEDSDASKDDGDEGPEDAGGSGEIQTRDDMKKELSNMSFEDIMKLQSQVGTKVYNEVAYGSKKRQGAGKKKRLNKNRPMEISAKRRPTFLRQVVSVKKPTSRDPRFDDLSGEYKPEIFEKTFKFINDIKQREREIVQKQLKKTKKNNEKKEKLQFLLKRMDNQERARKSREQQRERELQFKREQRERANQGARPFFLKNSDKKKLELAEKYQELKKSGKLENFLSKKRKRNAGKDRKKLPKQLQNKKFQ